MVQYNYFLFCQRQLAFDKAKELWGRPPKFDEHKIDECTPDNDFEEAVVQFMKDSIENFGHLNMVIPDISGGVAAMDMMAQSLVHEVGSLRAIVTKRDDRIKVIRDYPL